MSEEFKTDGHWPEWRKIPGQVVVTIGCECGETPKKRAARMSMEHVWHQSHRRRLGLQPVEYGWPDGAYHVRGERSTGGYMKVAGHVWQAGNGWVRDVPEPKDYEVVPGFSPLTYGELRAAQAAKKARESGK